MIEFHSFLQQFKRERVHPYGNGNSSVGVEEDVSTCLLAKLDLPLQLSGYTKIADPEASDGEEIYGFHGYALHVKIADIEIPLEVQVARVYYGSVNRYVECSYQEQAIFILIQIIDSLQQLPIDSDQIYLVLEEVVYLICFAGSILAMAPQPIQFTYP